MKLSLVKASTNVTVYVFIQDSSATDGSGLTGLVWNTASLVASQVRPLAARVAVTLATQTVTGAFSAGGFVEIDATNMPGIYRLDLPDTVCATGVDLAIVHLKGALNMAPVTLEIQLTTFDLNTDAVGTVDALGATAKTDVNAECDTALTDFAGPTKAEMDAAHALLATPANVATELGTYDGPTNAEMVARTLVAAAYFDAAADAVANVTTVATTTTNSDMRGTDSAALASVCTEARLAELAAANLPADVDTLLARLSAARALLLDQITALRLAELDAANLPAAIDAIPTTAMRGTDSAALATVCTEARLAELAAANLPTDVAAVKTDTAAILVDTGTTLDAAIAAVKAETALIVADTNELQADDVPGLIAALNDPTSAAIATAVLTTAMTESYAADGATMTVAQALYLVQQSIMEFAISGTTGTVKKLDGVATAATFTLDDATNPTSRTRAS